MYDKIFNKIDIQKTLDITLIHLEKEHKDLFYKLIYLEHKNGYIKSKIDVISYFYDFIEYYNLNYYSDTIFNKTRQGLEALFD